MDPGLVGPSMTETDGMETCIPSGQADAHLEEEDMDIMPLYHDSTLPSLGESDSEEKDQFMSSCPIFEDWPNKWRQEVRLCLKSVTIPHDNCIFHQGSLADRIYFVLSGEVKLVIDPRAHDHQFASFFQACEPLMDDTTKAKQYVPFLGLLSRYGGQRLQRCRSWPTAKADKSYDPMEPATQVPLPGSPSAFRKQQALAKKRARQCNVCYLGPGQLLGDAEVLLELQHYFASAYSEQNTTLLWIPKTHFNYIFKRKNPQCIPVMLQQLALVMNRRLSNKSLSDRAPLLKCILHKTQEKLGRRKPVEKEHFLFPLLRKKKLQKAGETSVDEPEEEETKKVAWQEERATKDSKKKKAVLFGTEPENLVEVPTEGIFQKVLQMANPTLSRQNLQVGNEEYKYLVSLRKRIGTQLSDVPAASQAAEPSSQEGRISRPCRVRNHATLGSRKTDAIGMKRNNSKRFSKSGKVRF